MSGHGTVGADDPLARGLAAETRLRPPGRSPDLAAALEGLDRATRDFKRRFGGPGNELEDAMEARMREAEQEARAYLDRAKLRADGLLRAMLEAVERETAEMRRDADRAVRAHREQAEAERQLEAARASGRDMAAQRQEQLAALADGIAARARALTAAMDDAERVRGQFGAFLHALSATAGRIAEDASPPATAGELGQLRRSPPPSDIAA